MQEVQITNSPYGHTLNSNQVFSPDDEWVVYDTRNDPTHINRTCCIEKVNVNTGEIAKLYSTRGQSLHGPGVGAASYHPLQNKIIFIHGLLNCDESQPYSFTRRFGAILIENNSGVIHAAEARTIDPPLVPGALRGGTHAHSWSADGKWISFTYNDFLLEKLSSDPVSGVKDLRTIGVMSPAGPVNVEHESDENFSGEYFSAVVATVTENPAPGTDQIEKAFDECWIGTEGYVRMDGSRQRRAIAFQGNVKGDDGRLITEVFVTDIPDDIARPQPGKMLEGTLSTRPTVPRGVDQRRITFTSNRKYPGLQGPRFWLRSSPDGSVIYFLMKDDKGVVQIYGVSVLAGEIWQVTSLSASIQGQFNISPDGNSIALLADNSVWICDVKTGKAQRVTEKRPDEAAPVIAVLWNKRGNTVVFNRYVDDNRGKHLQIFKVKVN